MLSTRVTACLFAFNEETRIREAVLDLIDAFPVLVVDNFSTDRTAEVAVAAGARVVQVKNPGYFETDTVITPVEQAVETPYLLIASVSELIPAELLRAYAEVAETQSAEVVRVRRISITAGQPIPLSGRPGVPHPGELRFFRKGQVDFSATVVHSWGSPRPGARVLRLEDHLTFYQFRDYDCSRNETAITRYNDLQARQLHARGRRFNVARAFGHTGYIFLHTYLWMGCYRYGAKGFLESVYVAWGRLSTWLRILELEQGLGLDSVKAANAGVRDRIRKQTRGSLARTGQEFQAKP